MTTQTNLFEENGNCLKERWIGYVIGVGRGDRGVGEYPNSSGERKTNPKQGMQNPNYSFGWAAGVISRISRFGEYWDEINTNHKHCAVCGEEKPLNFERLSGGRKSFICDECAERYVGQASKLIQTEPLLNGEGE